jgi:hypothetical protein
VGDGSQAPWAPAPIDEVVAAIARQRPAVVFAPHVETASGMMLPDDYLRARGRGHARGRAACSCSTASPPARCGWTCGPAASTCWSARRRRAGAARPAAPWSACRRARCGRWKAPPAPASRCDLKKWHQIMQAYETGSHAYHATMPTMALVKLRDTMRETRAARLRPGARTADRAGPPGARADGRARLSQRGRAGLRGAGRGGQLHHRSGHPERPGNSSPRACRPPPACR